jgi:hypothetical protein
MKLQQPIIDLGFTLKNEYGGEYVFHRQVGDNVIGFFEILIINTNGNHYKFFKVWGGKNIALPISFELHTAIAKTLYGMGLVR